MILNEEDFRMEAVLGVARSMCLAARTAPKARGLDLLEIIVAKEDSIKKISEKMKEIGSREKNNTFLRDSGSILKAQAIVIIGTKKQILGLRYCGFCGFANCAEASKNNSLCAFNPGDLGIAIGSAVSVAASHHVDNRIMYSVGLAAIELGLLGSEAAMAYGIPLSVSGKNPFFDRS